MKLYGDPPSRAVRPIWVLNELDLECEIIGIDILGGEHRTEAFRAINPYGKTPVLVDGELKLPESLAIMMYLAEAHGNGRFLPSGAIDRAVSMQWNLYLITEIEQPLWRIALHMGIYPEVERSHAEVGLARRDCEKMLSAIEDHLSNRTHMIGTELSVVDFNAAYTLDWADYQGLLAEAPYCRRFVEQLYDRPKAPPRIGEAFAHLETGHIAPRYRRDL